MAITLLGYVDLENVLLDRVWWEGPPTLVPTRRRKNDGDARHGTRQKRAFQGLNCVADVQGDLRMPALEDLDTVQPKRLEELAVVHTATRYNLVNSGLEVFTKDVAQLHTATHLSAIDGRVTFAEGHVCRAERYTRIREAHALGKISSNFQDFLKE